MTTWPDLGLNKTSPAKASSSLDAQRMLKTDIPANINTQHCRTNDTWKFTSTNFWADLTHCKSAYYNVRQTLIYSEEYSRILSLKPKNIINLCTLKLKYLVTTVFRVPHKHSWNNYNNNLTNNNCKTRQSHKNHQQWSELHSFRDWAKSSISINLISLTTEANKAHTETYKQHSSRTLLSEASASWSWQFSHWWRGLQHIKYYDKASSESTTFNSTRTLSMSISQCSI